VRGIKDGLCPYLRRQLVFLSEAVALVRGIKDGLCPYLRRQLI
jgi:hypothetical protein